MPPPLRRPRTPPCLPNAGTMAAMRRRAKRTAGLATYLGIPHDGGGDADETPTTMRTDAELIVAARTSEAAFRQLYDRYAERVHRYQLRRTGHADAALDLTAETFAQAWISRERFRDEADGSA